MHSSDTVIVAEVQHLDSLDIHLQNAFFVFLDRGRSAAHAAAAQTTLGQCL